MKLVVQHYDTTITIETPRDDLDIYEVIKDIIRPALLAMGYHVDNVDEALGEPYE